MQQQEDSIMEKISGKKKEILEMIEKQNKLEPIVFNNDMSSLDIHLEFSQYITEYNQAITEFNQKTYEKEQKGLSYLELLEKKINKNHSFFENSTSTPVTVSGSTSTPTKESGSTSTPTKESGSTSSPTKMSGSTSTPTKESGSTSSPTKESGSTSSPTKAVKNSGNSKSTFDDMSDGERQYNVIDIADEKQDDDETDTEDESNITEKRKGKNKISSDSSVNDDSDNDDFHGDAQNSKSFKNSVNTYNKSVNTWRPHELSGPRRWENRSKNEFEKRYGRSSNSQKNQQNHYKISQKRKSVDMTDVVNKNDENKKRRKSEGDEILNSHEESSNEPKKLHWKQMRQYWSEKENDMTDNQCLHQDIVGEIIDKGNIHDKIVFCEIGSKEGHIPILVNYKSKCKESFGIPLTEEDFNQCEMNKKALEGSITNVFFYHDEQNENLFSQISKADVIFINNDIIEELDDELIQCISESEKIKKVICLKAISSLDKTFYYSSFELDTKYIMYREIDEEYEVYQLNVYTKRRGYK